MMHWLSGVQVVEQAAAAAAALGKSNLDHIIESEYC